MFEVIDNKKQEALIKVAGVGGCSNAVDFMIERIFTESILYL